MNQRHNGLTFLLLCCLTSLVAAQDIVAIRGVSIIDGTGAPLLTEQTVLIRGNRIAAVGPTPDISVPKEAAIVNGKGKFLIPGLWDMHVHFRGAMKGGERLVKENEATLPVYVAHGVTGVREMGGDMVETVLQWREEIERGTRQGPRIATSGPKLDGPKPSWRGSIAVAAPDEARAAVRKLKAMGADFVKVYHGLGPESLVAVAEEAKRQRLRLTGHPGGNFTMLEISDLGMDIEHVFPGMGFASTRDELSLVRPPSGQRVSPFSLEGARIVVEQYDADAVRNLITRFLKNRTTLTPTLHAQWSTVLAPVLADKRRSHLMPRWLETWNDRGAVPSVILDPLRRKAKQIDARVTSELKAGGVTILAGSDTGASNQNLYPGSSLHAELVEFVEAGISPLQTIKAATLDAARWLGRDKELGSVGKGKLADLVLLDANPLDDIRNTLKISAVVANGKLLERSQLDIMLAAAQSGAVK